MEDDMALPDGAFYCTEMTPWQRGLTEPGTMIVHPDLVLLPRRWLTWGRFAQEMRCPICGTTWVSKIRQG
jgi:hypothetical protein